MSLFLAKRSGLEVHYQRTTSESKHGNGNRHECKVIPQGHAEYARKQHLVQQRRQRYQKDADIAIPGCNDNAHLIYARALLIAAAAIIP